MMYAEIMKCPETGAAFVKKLKEELKVCRNELCLRCGHYKRAPVTAAGGRTQKKIGLIDVDGHNFPNLALMRISAYHKAQGDDVEWYQPPLFGAWYDIVYMSKIFSDVYSPDVEEPLNADKVIKGGTGYNIQLVNGREVFNTHTHTRLPPEIERCFPDYSIYPQFDFAVSMTSRGCPNNCGFCHVTQKEGCRSVKVADVKDFWCGQKEIVSLDPNITACPDKRELFRQYMETGALVDFSQGQDIRLLDDNDIADVNAMRIKCVHFAWDNPAVDLRRRFQYYAGKAKHKPKGSYGMCYVLTNYEKCSVEEHLERALFRIYALRDMQYDPYVMVYDKPHAPKKIRQLQRWCNNKIIFGAVTTFSEYINSFHD